MSTIQHVTNKSLEQLSCAAALNSRKRLNLNVHRGYEENPQILYNCLIRGSYMRPHRHELDGRKEFFVCLKGEALLVIFTDTGEVDLTISMAFDDSSKVNSVVVEPLVWHSLVCVSEQAILLEVKSGPFQPNLAKEFAIWSPEEGDPSGLMFLEQSIALYAARV